MAVIAYQVRNTKILAQYRGTHRKKENNSTRPPPVINTNKVHCQSIKVNDGAAPFHSFFFLSLRHTYDSLFYFGFLHVVVIEKRTLGQYIYTVWGDGLTEKFFT